MKGWLYRGNRVRGVIVGLYRAVGVCAKGVTV